MRRYGIIVLGLTLCFALAGVALGQKNPRSTAKIQINGQEVSINYGQPSLRGRSISDLMGQVPAGGFWRLGADSSTTFISGTDLKFGDVTVPKGTYSLWAKKLSDTSWQLVFNTAHGMWGTMHAQHRSTDKYFVPLTQTKASSSQDRVTITLTTEGDNGGVLDIVWGDLELTTHFTSA
ncbi:MAG: DUF2911 domain-containing protein [Terriglobia bacterium]